MVLRVTVLLLILWSSLTYADSDSSVAIPSTAFTVFSNLKEVDPNTNKEIENMPRIQSQDTVGSCFGCAAATVAQKFACDTDKKIKELNIPCNQLPREKMISQLSMVAWTETNKEKQVADDSTNHTNLKLYSERSKFSLGTNALVNSASTFSFIPESCYPFEQLVNKYGDSKPLFEEVYFNIKKSFEKNKKNTEGSAPCLSCLEEFNSELNNSFNTNFTKDAISSALLKNSFGEFLFALLFNNCDNLTFRNKPKVRVLPELGNTISKEKALTEISKTITQNKPVHLDNICLLIQKNNNTCISSHSLVLSGYRTTCPTKNFSDKNCRPQFKIHNCWGQDWQTKNNDGWVDAKTLIDHINYGKDYITEGKISWLE